MYRGSFIGGNWIGNGFSGKLRPGIYLCAPDGQRTYYGNIDNPFGTTGASNYPVSWFEIDEDGLKSSIFTEPPVSLNPGENTGIIINGSGAFDPVSLTMYRETSFTITTPPGFVHDPNNILFQLQAVISGGGWSENLPSPNTVLSRFEQESYSGSGVYTYRYYITDPNKIDYQSDNTVDIVISGEIPITGFDDNKNVRDTVETFERYIDVEYLLGGNAVFVDGDPVYQPDGQLDVVGGTLQIEPGVEFNRGVNPGSEIILGPYFDSFGIGKTTWEFTPDVIKRPLLQYDPNAPTSFNLEDDGPSVTVPAALLIDQGLGDWAETQDVTFNYIEGQPNQTVTIVYAYPDGTSSSIDVDITYTETAQSFTPFDDADQFFAITGYDENSAFDDADQFFAITGEF